MSDKSRRLSKLTDLLLIALVFMVWTGCGLLSSGPGTQKHTPLTVSSITIGDCKDLDSLPGLDSLYFAQVCLVFSHDGEQTLSITHINGNITCCPDSLKVEVNLEDNLITIMEKGNIPDPEDNICYCICISDLNYSIDGIKLGEYTIKMKSPFESDPEADPVMQFSIDFRDIPVDTICRYRLD